MKNLIIVFLIFMATFSLEVTAKEYSVTNYPYPIVSSELATISSAIPYDRKYDFQKITLNLYPERDRVYLLEGRNEINVYYLKNKDQSPLAFVFSGVGGTGTGPVAESLMEQIYEAGYSVVSLPNPISWLFVLGASKSGIPGELSADVVDTYNLMKQVSIELANKGVLSRSFILLGYSQGAAILPVIDSYDKNQESPFNFDKVILLNPPFDFKKGIQTLDTYYEQSKSWSVEYKDATMGYLYQFAEKLMKVKSNPFQLLSQFHLSQKQQQFVIGQNYRDTLADILFTQEVLLGKKFLQAPVSWGGRSARYAEAKSFTFERYVDDILLPYLKSKKARLQDSESIYAQYSFENFKEHIVQSQKYYLFHNRNDFLLEGKDLKQYDSLFPESKRFIYPLGGHCGNYNFPINKMDLRSVLEYK